jgi:hypothetical protein
VRLRRRQADRARGRFGRPLIEIDYASSSSGPLPVAYLVDGATDEDARQVLAWIDAVRGRYGQSADAFIPRPSS